ncbi:MAG: transferase [Nitrospira sp. SG-bin1]|nr:MAG: transferase [Nitrospira sp. SG-bin1]
MRPLRIFTWHVHGNYLYYLTQGPHEFYLPIGGSGTGYAGAAPGFPWSARVHDLPIDEIPRLDFDVILFQSRTHYLRDQYDILTARQRRLPAIFLEHDPPQEHPTNTRHVVDDPSMLLVHVTPFNELMWDNGKTPTRIIEHGVLVPHGVRYTGEIPKGLVVVNGLRRRGRRLGSDVFERVRREIPLDLVGMESEELGGLGEMSHDALPQLMCRYRFMFNPIRYTSLGLSVCEAMALGVPVVGLATTEMATLIAQGRSGYVHTDLRRLIGYMQMLLSDPAEAHRASLETRREGQRRFNITRFIDDWNAVFAAALRQGTAYERPRQTEPLLAG